MQARKAPHIVKVQATSYQSKRTDRQSTVIASSKFQHSHLLTLAYKLAIAARCKMARQEHSK